MVRKRMVTGEAIAQIMNDYQNLSYDKVGIFGTDSYEKGMEMVIRQIARISMFTEAPIKMSNYNRKMHEELEQKYQEIVSDLGEIDKQKLNDLDETYRQQCLAEMEDSFIEGFVRGYRYLMNYFLFHSTIPHEQFNDELQIKKESHSAANTMADKKI